MKRLAPFALALWAAALLAQTAADPDQPNPDQKPSGAPRVSYLEDFSGVAKLRTDAEVQVDVRRWQIGGGVKLDRLPMDVDGLLIAQLRGGEVTTIIDGERQERRENEFWTVPAGSSMALETEDDSALLETIVIRRK